MYKSYLFPECASSVRQIEEQHRVFGKFLWQAYSSAHGESVGT